jgi:hypothetical protein
MGGSVSSLSVSMTIGLGFVGVFLALAGFLFGFFFDGVIVLSSGAEPSDELYAPSNPVGALRCLRFDASTLHMKFDELRVCRMGSSSEAEGVSDNDVLALGNR